MTDGDAGAIAAAIATAAARMRRSAACVCVLLTLTAVSAEAQGRGNVGKGRNTPASGLGATAASSGSDGGSVFAGREFGAWLDDATLLDPRHGSLSISLGHYRSPAGRQTDFPSADVAFGWSRRVQVGLMVPYSRVSAVDGGVASGRGDMYLNAKISIRDPDAAGRTHGFAVTPLLEILSEPDSARGGRVFWGLPISGEMRADRFRLYGSGGYFSRGVFFGSGAVEVPVRPRIVTTAALTWTRSLTDDAAADAIGMTRARVDLAGAASYMATSSLALFASVGRTISRTDVNSSTLMLNAGLSIAFAPPTRAPVPGATPPSRRR